MYRIFIAIIVIVLVLNVALLPGCIEKSSNIGADSVKHENNAKLNDIETATVIEQDKVSKSTPSEKILTEAKPQTSAITKYEIVSIKNVGHL